MPQPHPSGVPFPSDGAGPQPWPAGTLPVPGAPVYRPVPAPQPVAPDGRLLADLNTRLLAYIIDAAVYYVAALPGIFLLVVPFLVWLQAVPTDATEPWPTFPLGPVLAGSALVLVGTLVTYWNLGWRQGSSGQSIGKQAVRLRLVREADGQPLGGGRGLLRVVIRGLLGAASGGVWSTVTVLWPLWDARRQTLEDKLLHTLVVSER
jgi:uncharacterized RDD family membrane protein YckC